MSAYPAIDTGIVKVLRWDHLPRDLVAIVTPTEAVIARLDTGQFMTFKREPDDASPLPGDTP